MLFRRTEENGDLSGRIIGLGVDELTPKETARLSVSLNAALISKIRFGLPKIKGRYAGWTWQSKKMRFADILGALAGCSCSFRGS
jgi:hypothetical protein